MRITLLIDFGSTFTKVAAVSLEEERFLGRAQAPSTVDTDMTKGLLEALGKLRINGKTIEHCEIERKFACSSAAGGLKLVAVGLVPELTLEAARRAALCAGAKIVGSYSYELSEDDVSEIEKKEPDLVLLTGGTDGGNKAVIIHNAQMLAKSSLAVPIIVAGNRTVSGKIKKMLLSAGKIVEVTENVLPEIDRLNVEPVQTLIREIFIKRIVYAKGLNRAQEFIGDILMPTPLATLKAARLIADGTDKENGLGELMVIEVGGATTNIHTVSKPWGGESGAVLKGLPEPYAKRTVEGDLGIRYNAATILEVAEPERIKKHLVISIEENELAERIKRLTDHVSFVPETEEDGLIDVFLARLATDIAVERQVGRLREVFSPMGRLWIQYGKDCSNIKTVIATGGVFAHSFKPELILEAALFSNENPYVLKPRNPTFYIDQHYILYGIGLLADYAPEKALRIVKRSLKGPIRLRERV
ncbi:MAG: methylaspartate mutase accessory protein GlmL [Candidatus Bathyarchaeia archaeon]